MQTSWLLTSRVQVQAKVEILRLPFPLPLPNLMLVIMIDSKTGLVKPFERWRTQGSTAASKTKVHQLLNQPHRMILADPLIQPESLVEEQLALTRLGPTQFQVSEQLETGN